jgi:autotransporter translocation and assembly factor TamB
MSRLRAAGGITLVILLGVGILLASASLVLTRTRLGQEVVLRQTLSLIAGELNGRLDVGLVRSRQLLLGGTFVDVAFSDPDGRPFLVADSIEVSYSVPRLLAGDLRFSRIIVHHPRISVEKLPGQDAFNFMRIFAGKPEAPEVDSAALETVDTTAAEPQAGSQLPIDSVRLEPGERVEASPKEGGTRVVFRNLELRNGRVDVVYPLDPDSPPPERGIVESIPGVDGRVRRLVFDEVNGVLDEMRLVDPAFPGPLFVVDSLSLVGTVFDDPFTVQRFSGNVTWREGGIGVEADRLFLPGTEAAVTARVELGEGGPRVRADIDAWILSLADLQWAVPVLPSDGAGSAQLVLSMGPGFTEVGFTGADIGMGDSRVRGQGSVRLDTGLSLEGVDLELAPLELARLQSYLPDTLPVDGLLRGRVRLAGPATGPWVSAQVTLDQTAQGRAPTVADLTGIVHLDGAPGVTDLNAVLEPVQMDLFTDLFPELGIRGPGGLRLEATGRLAEGLRFTADLTHRPVDLPRSQVLASGTVTSRADSLFLAIDAELAPLSFTAWRVYRPDLPLSGEVTGTASATGPLRELRVTSDLETVAGSLSLDASFDARDPLARYRLTGELEDFRVSEIIPELPDPSTVTGAFEAEGQGLGRDRATGAASVTVWGSRLGKLAVDTAAAELRLAGGFLHIDTLSARTSVMDLGAAGSLALHDSLGSGEVRADFRSASLAGVRPFLMGDSLIARDTLSALERESLVVEGIDPDTLPRLADILVGGTARGAVTLSGSVQAVVARGEATVEEVRYGASYLGRARAAFAGSGFPGPDPALSVTVEADPVRLWGRDFEAGRFEGERRGGQGRGAVGLQRSETEEYSTRATFEGDTLGTLVHLDELTLRFSDRRWNLGGPARVIWGDGLLDVQDFRLYRPDGDGMDLSVEGRVTRAEESGLAVVARQVPLVQVAQLLQLDPEADFGGLVDLELRVRGRPSDPVISGSVTGTDAGYESIRLDRFDGSLEYADRRIDTRWTASRDGRPVLEAAGTVPIDLALDAAGDRIPDEPMDLSIAVDAFPAGLVMGLLESFEDVQGSLTGEFHVAGTLASPSPSGSLRLIDGAAVVPDLGVRHSGVEADFRLSPDGTVEVDGMLSSIGTMAVTGSVRLDSLSNPLLDLTAEGSGFLAADRADVLATVGGRMTVQGRYRRPLVEGDVSVESGVLFLDEIQRTSEMVDLTDPSFFDVVDTTTTASQPLLDVGENPFLRNLRLNVDLSLSRDFWLRSDEMNVEIEGDLQVVWARANRDLAMLGELEAVRGTYSRFGRQFQVQQGTVRFIGTPGLDPDLNILAVNRLRVRDGEPLNILALLEGTLLSPRVTLSSDAQPPIAQSELVSYLIFGRPTYELASSEFSFVQGEFGGLFGSAAGAGASLAFGALGTQLGSAVAQEIGLDYFAISQAQGATTFGTGFESALRATQVEVGWYVAQDMFLALLLRPLLGINSAGISGARLEWRATDLWTVEGFLEDRFARDLNSGFSINEAFQVPKVWGLFLAREWGY